jgi:hypothetical protein
MEQQQQKEQHEYDSRAPLLIKKELKEEDHQQWPRPW